MLINVVFLAYISQFLYDVIHETWYIKLWVNCATMSFQLKMRHCICVWIHNEANKSFEI